MPRYQFVSPGAEASNQIEAFLLRREEEERRNAYLKLEQQRREAEIAERQQREAREREAMEMDAALATADIEQRRQAEAMKSARLQDAAGVRGMMADVLQNQPPGPETGRTLAGIAIREGMPIPGIVAGMMEPPAAPKRTVVQTIDAQGRPIRRAVTEEELTAGVREYVEPKEPGAGNSRADAAESYQERGATRLTNALDELEGQIGPLTVGTWRAGALRQVPLPGSVDPTVDFDALTEQVKALIGFDELNRMRRASPTGGALGQVSNQEIAYLQSVAGSLNPNQSEEAFRRQLAKVRADIQRVVDYGLGGGAGARVGGPGPGPAASAPAKPSAADLIKKYSRP